MDRDITPAGRSPTADIASDDWDVCFGALIQTLSLRTDEWCAASPGVSPSDAAALAHAQVLDCVAGLRQLNAALRHESRGRQPLEPDRVVTPTEVIR